MFSYTNRKGVVYYLHASTTAKGNTRYTMTRSAEGALAELPAGYEISENVNGQVSARRARPRQILEEEARLVQTCLREIGPAHHRMEVKGKQIVLFEPMSDIDAIAAMHSPFGGLPGDISDEVESMARSRFGSEAVDAYVEDRHRNAIERAEKRASYAPVLRFVLKNRKSRLFDVARMTYRGHGGWRWLDTMPLPKAARKYIKHLGKDSFFDLI